MSEIPQLITLKTLDCHTTVDWYLELLMRYKLQFDI
jgi:hypothetical protein